MNEEATVGESRIQRTFPFVKTTLMGGLLVLLPLGLMGFLIAKAVGIIKGLTAPIVARLPEQLHHPTLIAVLLLLAACFLTGLITRTALGRRCADAIESHFLNHIPGYTFFRSLTSRFAGGQGADPFVVCLADIDDTLVPAFIVEEHDNEYYTIFVPSTPTPSSGDVHIILKERVHVVDVTLPQALACVTRWGAGSGKFIEAMRRSEQRQVAPRISETSIEQT